MSTGEQKTNDKEVDAEQMLANECEILSTLSYQEIFHKLQVNSYTIPKMTTLTPSNITALVKTFHCSLFVRSLANNRLNIFFIVNYSPHSSNHTTLCIGQHKALDILCCLPIFTKILVVACQLDQYLRLGNLLMLLATRMSILAPFRWSPCFT